MRLLYLGMNGVFSYLPLAAILRAKAGGGWDWLEITAVILPASAVSNYESRSAIAELPPERPQSALPMVRPYLEETTIHLAWANGIPVYVAQNLGQEVEAFIKEAAADIACAACFPQRVPASILAVPKNGFLNLHPSLLPAYRGPAPLFWIFRYGEQANGGVTLHWMAEALDSGDILSQRRLPLADGISGPEADRLFGAVGGEILVAGLKQIAEGKAEGEEQPEGGSYYSWPTADDFKLERTWSARRAFNFMRGTAEWNQVYPLEIGSSAVMLRKAVAFYPEQRLSQPLVEEDGLYRIQFLPGVLEVR